MELWENAIQSRSLAAPGCIPFGPTSALSRSDSLAGCSRYGSSFPRRLGGAVSSYATEAGQRPQRFVQLSESPLRLITFFL
jgi:hypothetical protein